MAKATSNQPPSTNGHELRSAKSEQPDGRLTMAQRRAIQEEGITQTLLSGIEVQMWPVRIEKLLAAGNVPDILTPIMLKGLYENINDDLTEFVTKQRDEKAETLEMICAVNAVCEASLVDPSLVDYLDLTDRFWLFKLAFQPAEVLSTFRLGSAGDVGRVDEGEQVSQVAQ